MIASPNGYILSCELTVTRQQVDGTDKIETITVSQQYGPDGKPTGPATEVKEVGQ